MMRAREEALHNLSRVAFESSQTVRQGVQAQRLPQIMDNRQVKPGNAAAASVRPNRLAAGALRALDRRHCSLPCNEHATLSLPCQSRAKHVGRPRQVVQSFPKRWALRATACFLVAGLTLAGAALADEGKPNTLDPQDRATRPALIDNQQSEYRRLRDQWQTRHIPRGLAAATGAPTARDSKAPSVGIEVENVDYEIADGIGFHVHSLKGALVPVTAGEPINFDDPDQYRIHIYAGRVTLSPAQIDALFNRYVLSYAPRSLSSVANTTEDGRLIVDVGARLRSFLPPIGGLPTRLSGPVRVTPDNKLAYTPDQVTSLGLPLRPVLDAIGLTLADITPLDRPGARLDGDTLIMDPERLFPAPTLEIDRIKSVALSPAGMTLEFTSDQPVPTFDDPPVSTDSYIWLQSGDARFYGTLLVNARLALVNEDNKPLHFYLYDYRAQTAAGQIDGLADGTLVARVPNTAPRADEPVTVTENRADD